VIGADDFVIQMASIVKECALGHSKHRIQQPVRGVVLTVLKMRCGCQIAAAVGIVGMPGDITSELVAKAVVALADGDLGCHPEGTAKPRIAVL
jgi:hypothetical protein